MLRTIKNILDAVDGSGHSNARYHRKLGLVTPSSDGFRGISVWIFSDAISRDINRTWKEFTSVFTETPLLTRFIACCPAPTHFLAEDRLIFLCNNTIFGGIHGF